MWDILYFSYKQKISVNLYLNVRVVEPAVLDADVVHVNWLSVAEITLQTDEPSKTLVVVDVKPFPFKVNTRPPLTLPCVGDILCTDAVPVTLKLDVA